MAVQIEPKENQSLDIMSIAIGMRDAYYHFPDIATQKELSMLSCKFAIEVHKLALCDSESIVSVINSYIAGYKLGSQQCARMDSKEHKKILSNFYRLESEEGNTGLLLIFSSFKEEIEDLLVTRGIKTIDDFNSKMEIGE